jgi:hypothetical protein
MILIQKALRLFLRLFLDKLILPRLNILRFRIVRHLLFKNFGDFLVHARVLNRYIKIGLPLSNRPHKWNLLVETDIQLIWYLR